MHIQLPNLSITILKHARIQYILCLTGDAKCEVNLTNVLCGFQNVE